MPDKPSCSDCHFWTRMSWCEDTTCCPSEAECGATRWGECGLAGKLPSRGKMRARIGESDPDGLSMLPINGIYPAIETHEDFACSEHKAK